MAVLPDINLALSAVRTKLGYVADWSLFNIGTSDLINKWSRYKPVRAAGLGETINARPAGDDGYFGLNMAVGVGAVESTDPTSVWAYLHPEGGSDGGDPDEPVRLGDFRGYEHDKAQTDPPVYADYASDEVEGGTIQPTTATHPINQWAGSWRFGKNTAHGNVRLLDTDLGLEDLHWGVRLDSPAPAADSAAPRQNL